MIKIYHHKAYNKAEAVIDDQPPELSRISIIKYVLCLLRISSEGYKQFLLRKEYEIWHQQTKFYNIPPKDRIVRGNDSVICLTVILNFV